MAEGVYVAGRPVGILDAAVRAGFLLPPHSEAEQLYAYGGINTNEFTSLYTILGRAMVPGEIDVFEVRDKRYPVTVKYTFESFSNKEHNGIAIGRTGLSQDVARLIGIAVVNEDKKITFLRPMESSKRLKVPEEPSKQLKEPKEPRKRLQWQNPGVVDEEMKMLLSLAWILKKPGSAD